MSGQIFIAYRRTDAPGVTGRLYDRIRNELPRDSIFMDVDVIEPGVDFKDVITRAVVACDVLIAIIGRSWTAATDESGKRRIDDPNDFIRIEIRTALENKIRVFPVLIDDVAMPTPEELPEDLRQLSFLQAIELRHTRFAADVQVLIGAIKGVLREKIEDETEESPIADLTGIAINLPESIKGAIECPYYEVFEGALRTLNRLRQGINEMSHNAELALRSIANQQLRLPVSPSSEVIRILSPYSIANVLSFTVKEPTVAEEEEPNEESPSLRAKVEKGEFDVFLSYNSKDRDEVSLIDKKLRRNGVRPWLDVRELRPGFAWQRILEDQIEQIGAAAVFVGRDGIGPWQQQETDAYLREFVDRKSPVIPVILASSSVEPNLPIFLRGRTWVDFRKVDPNPMENLIWGITGRQPDRVVG